MDSFDVKLLELIQVNNRLTSDQLGEKIGLSASAVQRRIKRFRKDGVIESEIAVLSPQAVGRPLTIIVTVTLERETPEILDSFKASMSEIPEVMQCYYVTGEADFFIVFTARSMNQYEEFTRLYFFENSNVKRFQSSVVMDRVKVGLSIPIDINTEPD
jgi:Lrp/AsnC family leucine-responsive transcriptional regulator